MNIAKIVTVCAAWGVLALVSCGKLVATDGNIDVIPLPEKVVAGEGAFVLKPTTSVVLYFAPENIDKAVDLWRDVMEETLGVTMLKVADGSNLGGAKRNVVNVREIGRAACRERVGLYV